MRRELSAGLAWSCLPSTSPSPSPFTSPSTPTSTSAGSLEFQTVRCSSRARPAVLGRLAVLVVAQVEGGVDDPQVRQRLREVAEEAPGVRLDFLGEEADIVAQ